MTRRAQRNQIGQGVGFAVVLQSEAAKWGDMVHVKLFAKCLLGYAAMLAGVSVAATRIAALLGPVWAVRRNGAALPVWVGRAAPGLLQESAKAGRRAKVVSDFFHFGQIASERLAANLTGHVQAAARPRQIARCLGAGTRTMHLGPTLSVGECFAALWTVSLNLFIGGVAGMRAIQSCPGFLG